jgi:uncharacterized membrane protein
VLAALMPETLVPAPQWLAPVTFAGFAVAVLAMDPGRIDRRQHRVHVVRVAYIAALACFVLASTVQLTVALVRGESGITDSASNLLLAGANVWTIMAITFAFVYWELDLGGPGERAHTERRHPDFAFPQDMNPDIARPDWRPEYLDYLYLGITNNMAFSPTDVMPLARWAKAAMSIQSVAALVILGLVIARAVNILT